jgi:hypothetical protein
VDPSQIRVVGWMYLHGPRRSSTATIPDGKGGMDVFVQAIARIGDLAKRAAEIGNDPGEERRRWLLDLATR